jgi:hypothetical protein
MAMVCKGEKKKKKFYQLAAAKLNFHPNAAEK